MKSLSLRPATPSQRRLAAWSGILAPALFVVIFTLEGFLRPGYNPLSTYVSALSLGPRGWIQIVNFLVFGTLLFVFTRGLAAAFPDGKASRWGLILLTAISVLFFISGPFVMDPMGTPQAQATVHGTIHGLAGGIAFLCMPIGIFVFLRRFHSDPRWRFLYIWTLVLGVIVTAALLVFTVISKSPDLTATFVDWLGLFQRALIVPYMLWLFVFALGVRQHSQTA
jgi:hypothetical protein